MAICIVIIGLMWDNSLTLTYKGCEKMPRIIVACESSQTVAKAFHAKGWDVTSVDILPKDNPSNVEHIQDDIFTYLDWAVENQSIDLLIGFPPCTDLSCIGVAHFHKKGYRKFSKRYPSGVVPNSPMAQGLEFVRKLMFDYRNYIPRIAIENPQGVIGTRLPITVNGKTISYGLKKTQTIQPFEFGYPWSKKTFLWHNLPLLVGTNKVELDPDNDNWINKLPNSTNEIGDRWKVRSKLCEGFGLAMADQWGNL